MLTVLDTLQHYRVVQEICNKSYIRYKCFQSGLRSLLSISNMKEADLENFPSHIISQVDIFPEELN